MNFIDAPLHRKRWLSIAVLVWLLSAGLHGSAYAAPVAPAALDSLLHLGKEALYNLDIEQAGDYFRQSQQQFPGYPHGHVFQAYLTSMIWVLDTSNDSLKNRLLNELDQAMKISEAYKQNYPKKPDGYFYVALTSSIKAMYHVVDRSFLKAYGAGRKSKKNLEKVVEIDSTYYDAYLGLGLFHYYADLLPGMLKFIAWILGFDGDRVKGRNEIQLAAESGEYFHLESEFLDYSIGYFLEGEKSKSFRGLLKLHQRYPANEAFSLIIAYHYRRTGFPQRCIDYCQKISERHKDLLPDIVNLKYYNMAVSYFLLNNFSRADSLFAILEQLPTRKSEYYQAALHFFKGQSLDMQFQRQAALKHYLQIPNTKKTQYWYWQSRPLIEFPMDSLMIDFIRAENWLASRQFSKSRELAARIEAKLAKGAVPANPDLPRMTLALLADNEMVRGRLNTARKLYEQSLQTISKMRDQFRKAWIYIRYARCLRALKEYDLAERMFGKARALKDDYTRIIIEREKFILKKRREADEKKARESKMSD